METSGESSSKRLAFSATVGIHFILILFFLFSGFVVPEKAGIVKVDESSASAGFQGIELFKEEISLPATAAKHSAKLISDPAENKITITQVTETVKSEIPSDSDPGFEAIQKKWRLNRNGKVKGAGANGTSFTDTKGNDAEEKEGNELGTAQDTAVAALSSRRLIEKPASVTTEAVEAVVVVEIVVDEKGNVIRAVAGQRGTTTTSKVLYEKAEKAAMTAKFSPSPQGIKEQRGTYTFVFTLE